MPDIPALLRALTAAEDAYTAMTSGTLPAGYTSLIRADRTLVPQTRTRLASQILADVEIFGVVGPGVLAIRGTYTLEEWLEDVEALLVPGLVPDTGWWHVGFTEVYLSIRAAVLALAAPGPILVVGHSLGAALACYAAMDLAQLGASPTVITFGGPRCGDARWAADAGLQIPCCTRVVNHGDIVPHVPLPPLFRHVLGSTLVPVHGGFRLNDVTFGHHLTTYKVGLERLMMGVAA